MEYAIIVGRTDGTFETVSLEDWHLSLQLIHEKLNDGFFEIVVPVMFRNTLYEDVRMLVDDMGLLKELEVNKVATGLYGSPFDVIVGDVIYCTASPQVIEDEPDIYAFSSTDAFRLLDFLVRMETHVHDVKITE